MTETGPPRKDLVCVRGDSVTIEIGPVTIEDQNGGLVPLDLTVAGTKAWLTVKAKDEDADPGLWQGTIVGGEITADDPPTAAKNYMTARIPKHTFNFDTVGFAADRVTLIYDAEIETGSRHETVVRGNLVVVADVGHA